MSRLQGQVNMTAPHLITAPPASYRSNIGERGIRVGHLGPVVLRMPWPAQDALEARCARTGETMAEALVAFWAEAQA